ncbi:ABC transporter permease [Skermanella mucosa]|uniref:MlaE family ABC transporter permease n=1 Tax=Skermanella mucosa TaxID=1789672 RepID=UPI00192BB93E|nr:ABC transporter permease [Skermanella mucosa]UEM19995.1 ABC transporter permease [Skermanella mucosa]
MTAVIRQDRSRGDGRGNEVELRPGDAGRLALVLSGDWRIANGLAGTSDIESLLGEGRVRTLVCEDGGLRGWDSALVSYLLKVRDLCAARDVGFDAGALPPGVVRLIALARAVPVKADAARGGAAATLPVRVGRAVLDNLRGADQAVSFLGEIMLGLGRMLVGRARFRRVDFLQAIEDAGAQALPIVTIVSLLVGLTVAFVGAIQLQQFGADIYVANLVGLAMTREMAALMTAIVLAGRTGAAYAAQLGTMQGNEEIDALSTIGISPIDFLVLPRVLALALMMPLLFVYSCFLGLLGGYIVGVAMLGLSGNAYIIQTIGALSMTDFWVGFVKSIVFGMLVAYAGALRGMQAGRSAQAVGVAATSAVVTSIVFIIVVDAVFAVMTNLLGI